MKVVPVIAVVMMVGTTPLVRTAADQNAQHVPSQVCTLKVSGMTCAGCEAAVRIAARTVDGVTDVKVSYAKATAEVAYDPSKTAPEAIVKAITTKSGFKAELMAGAAGKKS